MADTNLAPHQTLEGIAQGSMPILETMIGMHLDTVDNCTLDSRAYNLVRLAALVAVDAPPASYMANLPIADEAGVTLEDAQGVLVAIASIVGNPRLVSAAGNVLRGLDMAETLADQ